MASKRSIIISVLVLVFTIGTASFFLLNKRAPKEKKQSVREIVVPVERVSNKEIKLNLSVVGKLQAQQKVEVFAEVSGILEISNKAFLEGVRYSKGEMMLRVNSDKFNAEVISQRSSFMTQIASVLPDLKFDYPVSYQKWKLYLGGLDVEQNLKPIPEVDDDKEKYFLAGKSIYSTYYSIKALEEQLEKYVIDAPFRGEVIESNIKPGGLIRTGQKLGEFVNPYSYDLVVGVSVAELSGIEIGNRVTIGSEQIDEEWTGVVRRISKKIDDSTQMVDVFISVSGDHLKEGMFLTAIIELNEECYGIEIPRKLLVGDKNVFVVEDNKVVEREVKIVQKRGDVAIVEGLVDDALLSYKTVGLHAGVTVNAVLN